MAACLTVLIAMSLPSYDEFIECDDFDKRVSVVDELFEPSYSILRFTVRNKDFMQQARQETRNYGEFIELIRSRLLQISHDTAIVGPSSRDVDHLAEIVSAHPRLGESKKRLSAHSEKEQRNLNNSGDPPEIQTKLIELNKNYEEVYPGLKFVVFVNGRSRLEIIKIMEERIHSGNSWFEEVDIAINELCCIALDRVKKWEAENLNCKY